MDGVVITARGWRKFVAQGGGRVLGNWSIYALGGLLPHALSVLLLPIFTRYLSPHDYGVLAYTTMLASFFTIVGSLSIQTYVVRRYYDCRTSDETRHLFGTTFVFVGLYNVLLLAVAYATLPQVFRTLDVQVPFSPYVELTLLSMVMDVVGLIPLAYFRARERAGVYVLLAVTPALLNSALSVYLVVAQGMGLLGRYYGQLAAFALFLVVNCVIMTRIGRIWRYSLIRDALVFSLPLVPAQFIGVFVNMSDRLVLERFTPMDQLGTYSVGFGMASSAAMVMGGMYLAIQPMVFRLASESRLDTMILSVKRYILAVTMTVMCVVIALSQELVKLLTAPAFHESYKIGALLVIPIALQAFITLVPSLYIVAMAKTRYETPIRSTGALAGLVAMLILVPLLGTYGAAVASIISALVTLFTYHLVICRRSGVRLGLGRDVVLMGLACALGYGILQLQSPLLLLTAAIKLVAIGACVAVYLWKTAGALQLNPDVAVSRAP